MDGSNDKLGQCINAAVSEVLKTIASMDITSDETPTEEIHEVRWVSMDVLNPVQGQFRLLMSREMTKKITKTMFGVSDSSLTDALLEDSLSELLNTVVGRLMTLLLPKDQAYQLGLPGPGKGKYPQLDRSTLVFRFLAENERIRLTVSGEILRGTFASASPQSIP